MASLRLKVSCWTNQVCPGICGCRKKLNKTVSIYQNCFVVSFDFFSNSNSPADSSHSSMPNWKTQNKPHKFDTETVNIDQTQFIKSIQGQSSNLTFCGRILSLHKWQRCAVHGSYRPPVDVQWVLSSLYSITEIELQRLTISSCRDGRAHLSRIVHLFLLIWHSTAGPEPDCTCWSRFWQFAPCPICLSNDLRDFWIAKKQCQQGAVGRKARIDTNKHKYLPKKGSWAEQ